jgi:leucyl aminopeptidase
MPEAYKKHIESDIADMKNMGKAGQAGAIAAALLLARFVDGVPWVHLDIAGPARSDDDDGVNTKGGTGFGVRTLLELLDSYDAAGA